MWIEKKIQLRRKYNTHAEIFKTSNDTFFTINMLYFKRNKIAIGIIRNTNGEHYNNTIHILKCTAMHSYSLLCVVIQQNETEIGSDMLLVSEVLFRFNIM